MITLRSLMVAAVLIAALALPGAANAATGFTTGDVCPGNEPNASTGSGP